MATQRIAQQLTCSSSPSPAPRCADDRRMRRVKMLARPSVATTPMIAMLCAGVIVMVPSIAFAQVTDPQPTAPNPAQAPAPLPDSASEQAPGKEIVVTGSRIAKRDFKSDSPISTIGADSIAATGAPTLDRGIGEMPQFSAAQGASEVGDVQGATGFGGGQSYSDLRGLGPNRALVLVDGRRPILANPNGSVDLNIIPTSMVQSVEVITGGASAAYGSDAIAGVINFKLKDHFKGVEASVTHGATTLGDGDTNLYSLLLGGNLAEDRGNFVIDLEYSDRAAVQGSTRPFFRGIRQLARPPEGIVPGGLFGTPPTIAAVNAVLATYPGTTPIAGSGPYNGAIGVNTDGTIFTDLAGPNCVQNYRGLGPKGLAISPNCQQVQIALGQYFAVQVPLQKYNAFASGNYKITDHIDAYAQFAFMETTARDETAGGSTGPGVNYFVPLNNPFVTGNPALQAILASRAPDPANPGALTQPLALTKLLSMSGNRIQTFKYDDYQITAGLRGDVFASGLTFDVYGSFGRSLFTNIQTNDTSTAAITSILNGTANYSGSAGTCIGYAWNPLGNNALSAGCREYAVRENHNSSTVDQRIVEGTIQGPIVTLPAGDLSFALGADHRTLSFDYRPAPGLVTNDTVTYDTAVPASGTQHVTEAFGELSIPIFKDRRFLEDVSLDLGYRYSRYNLFGGVSTYKAEGSWAPFKTLRFRGGYERAIRAPSVGELFAPTVTGNLNIGTGPNAGDPCAVGSTFRTGSSATQVASLCQAQGVPSSLYPTYTYGVASVHGVSGGNANLTPEKGDTYSFGIVWTPDGDGALFSHFSVSVDYYNIGLANAVGSLTLTSILPRCFNADGISNPTYSTNNIYCNQITRDTHTGNIILGREGLLNLASYHTDGIDTQINWKFGLDAIGLSSSAGSIEFNSVISYLRSFKVSALPGSPILDFAGSIGNSSVSPEIAHPRWKTYTSFTYATGPVRASLHWRLIDAMKHQDQIVDPTSTTPGVGLYNYFDIDASWKFLGRLELSGGIANLTDRPPPFVSGQPLTTDSATYDIIGRTYHVTLKAKF
ncbi:MAG: hypothetical protein JWR80_7569 [Bradyrhizobium sp.]|nr:hypothetical protein [Bradyrhizobium sp.]